MTVRINVMTRLKGVPKDPEPSWSRRLCLLVLALCFLIAIAYCPSCEECGLVKLIKSSMSSSGRPIAARLLVGGLTA